MFWQIKRAVLCAGKSRKRGGLRFRPDSKRGVLGAGQVKKRGGGLYRCIYLY